MKKIKRIISILILVFTIFFLTGCWNNVTLKQRSIVVAVGVERIEDKVFELTIQVANPSKLGPDSGSSDSGVSVFSDTGETIFEAVRNIVKKINRKPYYGHLQLIIIGEKLAIDDIVDVLDFFERDHEPRLDPYVLISDNVDPKEILEVESTIEKIPAMHIKDIIDNTRSSGKIKKSTLVEILHDINYPELNPSIGVIKRITEGKVSKISDLEVEGTAVIKRTQLVGYLDGIQTRAISFIKNEMKSGIIKVENPLDKEKKVSIEIIRSKTKINTKFDGDMISFDVNITSNGSLGSQQGNGNLTSEKMIIKLENEIQKELKNEIEETVKILQNDFDSDILGFAEIISDRHPKYWEEIRNNWDRIFKIMPIHININFEIRRTGLINKTTEAQ